MQTSKQSNLNALINQILKNTSKLTLTLCESHLSELSIPCLEAFLHLKFSKVRKLSNTKMFVHETKPKFGYKI